MNKIAFEAMTDRKRRDLYECMWGSEAFDFPVEKTLFKGHVSYNSYTFVNVPAGGEDICRDRLEKLFGILNPVLFREKFTQSTGGSGQEWKRIATLHSSALCALLFFYNVSEENPYIVEIGNEEYVFTYSRFEYQNTVIEGRNPSNIDVVLVGRERKSGRPAVLFLESKFSEYYEGARNSLKIAMAYLDNSYGKAIYEGDFLTKAGFEIKEKGSECFTLSSEETCYIEGIKQMISHYIGVRNLLDSMDRRDGIAVDGARVLLGEILFTKGIGRLHIGDGEECFSSYRRKYLVLAGALNRQLMKDGINDRFAVVGDILSYSQFEDKRFIQEPQIKKFYFESGNGM